MVKKIIQSIFKNSVVRMIVALTLVGVISGVSLVFVYNYAMPKIKVNISKETEQSIKNIFSAAKNIKPIGGDALFQVEDENDKVLGYAFIAAGNGYQGIIKLIVGVTTDLKTMKGMEVLESQETPGLGAEIASPGFRGQFENLTLVHPIEYVKNQKPEKPYQIEAITGATISSRAVVNILNKRIKQVRELLEDRK